ncbi:hypothetical protein KIH41_08230 [Litoribacter ruber]|uniref:Uncharacterized protein n=1 Tax=Litoribacter ruber TaxID=702568 RepID=A0AAP2CEE5_9BACT|nr:MULTISPECIES: hypothetical protein [Litoribacter]MBS9522768.1 hypothetical protein [Litoribacter alkaliphilus]MBT0811266.1 hypothetical protein [Litoribacter ruber]
MEYITELLKIVLPAGLVIYGMYIIAVSFLKRERDNKLIELKTKNTDTVLPIRLQAGERLCLLLERITPNNLVRRVNDGSYSARELHAVLLSEVREEFNHNLSQQVYFTDETWESVRKAVEDVITMINRASQDLNEEARGLELAKRIFQLSLEQKMDSIKRALQMVKSEIRIYF